jgi:phosphotransferase system HPr-like phosphotransfer protein
MAGVCSTCTSSDKAAIEALIASGAGLSKLERQFGITRDALRRHRDRHMSMALTTLRAEQGHSVQIEATARDRVENLVAKLEALVERTDSERRESMLLQASRELRGAIELLARLSGELRPDMSVNVAVVNLATSDEWQRTRAVILGRLRQHPEALADVLDGLRSLDPQVIDVTPGASK